jgi:hypothetical protein
MTKALPDTAAGIARRITGIRKAGLYPLGVTTDGTVLMGDKPIDPASLAPVDAAPSPAPARRFGEKLDGGLGET